eukprot:COSAG04_NODE_6046_length_1422_cov_5.589569_2_plen_173_part_00
MAGTPLRLFHGLGARVPAAEATARASPPRCRDRKHASGPHSGALAPAARPVGPARTGSPAPCAAVDCGDAGMAEMYPECCGSDMPQGEPSEPVGDDCTHADCAVGAATYPECCDVAGAAGAADCAASAGSGATCTYVPAGGTQYERLCDAATTRAAICNECATQPKNVFRHW